MNEFLEDEDGTKEIVITQRSLDAMIFDVIARLILLEQRVNALEKKESVE